MYKLLVFGGTTEGRRLLEYLAKCEAEVTVCVATAYGRDLLPTAENIHILTGRLDKSQMEELISREKFDCIIDATHPYAIEVTTNILGASISTGTQYLRLLREQEEDDNCIYVHSAEEAADYLEHTTGNVLLTTGSKELAAFSGMTDYTERLFPRVLPTPAVVARCYEMGFSGRNLICMQGPFSYEMNLAMINSIHAAYLVTKESGDVGGFSQKMRAAEEAGVQVIVIGRPPQQSGYSYDEVIQRLRQNYDIFPKAEAGQEAAPYFPLFVDLDKGTVRFFGGGNIATRRVETMLQFPCEVEVIAPVMSRKLEDYALQHRLTHLQREYKPGDCAGARLVVAATDNREVNHAIAEECRAAGIPVSVADVKSECSFYFPAVIRRGEVVIGVTASGANHRLARQTADNIRSQLSSILPGEEKDKQ